MPVCFFCGTVTAPHLQSREEIAQWIAKHGEYRRLGGKVGRKSLCERCLGELKVLIEMEG